MRSVHPLDQPPGARPRLSVCIPTFNRIEYLKNGLGFLLPQVVAAPRGAVEIVLVNNASTDGTREYIEQLADTYDFIRVFNNPSNLGFDGNAAKCIEYAAGDYLALLSDDDVYLEGQVSSILAVMARREFALILLNYYCFFDEVHRRYKTFAPERDVEFARAGTILNYPSVGHFSGFIYRADLAKKALADLLAKDPVIPVNGRARGIYFEVALHLTLATSLPACFVGARRLAARVPRQTDYIGLEHICLEYCQGFHNLFDQGLLSRADLAYRDRLVVSWLPRRIIADAPRLSDAQLRAITNELTALLASNRAYSMLCLPMLRAGRLPGVKAIYRWVEALLVWGRNLRRALNA